MATLQRGISITFKIHTNFCKYIYDTYGINDIYDVDPIFYDPSATSATLSSKLMHAYVLTMNGGFIKACVSNATTGTTINSSLFNSCYVRFENNSTSLVRNIVMSDIATGSLETKLVTLPSSSLNSGTSYSEKTTDAYNAEFLVVSAINVTIGDYSPTGGTIEPLMYVKTDDIHIPLVNYEQITGIELMLTISNTGKINIVPTIEYEVTETITPSGGTTGTVYVNRNHTTDRTAANINDGNVLTSNNRNASAPSSVLLSLTTYPPVRTNMFYVKYNAYAQINIGKLLFSSADTPILTGSSNQRYNYWGGWYQSNSGNYVMRTLSWTRTITYSDIQNIKIICDNVSGFEVYAYDNDFTESNTSFNDITSITGRVSAALSGAGTISNTTTILIKNIFTGNSEESRTFHIYNADNSIEIGQIEIRLMPSTSYTLLSQQSPIAPNEHSDNTVQRNKQTPTDIILPGLQHYAKAAFAKTTGNAVQIFPEVVTTTLSNVKSHKHADYVKHNVSKYGVMAINVNAQKREQSRSDGKEAYNHNVYVYFQGNIGGWTAPVDITVTATVNIVYKETEWSLLWAAWSSGHKNSITCTFTIPAGSTLSNEVTILEDSYPAKWYSTDTRYKYEITSTSVSVQNITINSSSYTRFNDIMYYVYDSSSEELDLFGDFHNNSMIQTLNDIIESVSATTPVDIAYTWTCDSSYNTAYYETFAYQNAIKVFYSGYNINTLYDTHCVYMSSDTDYNSAYILNDKCMFNAELCAMPTQNTVNVLTNTANYNSNTNLPNPYLCYWYNDNTFSYSTLPHISYHLFDYDYTVPVATTQYIKGKNIGVKSVIGTAFAYYTSFNILSNIANQHGEIGTYFNDVAIPMTAPVLLTAYTYYGNTFPQTGLVNNTGVLIGTLTRTKTGNICAYRSPFSAGGGPGGGGPGGSSSTSWEDPCSFDPIEFGNTSYSWLINTLVDEITTSGTGISSYGMYQKLSENIGDYILLSQDYSTIFVADAISTSDYSTSASNVISSNISVRLEIPNTPHTIPAHTSLESKRISNIGITDNIQNSGNIYVTYSSTSEVSNTNVTISTAYSTYLCYSYIMITSDWDIKDPVIEYTETHNVEGMHVEGMRPSSKTMYAYGMSNKTQTIDTNQTYMTGTLTQTVTANIYAYIYYGVHKMNFNMGVSAKSLCNIRTDGTSYDIPELDAIPLTYDTICNSYMASNYTFPCIVEYQSNPIRMVADNTSLTMLYDTKFLKATGITNETPRIKTNAMSSNCVQIIQTIAFVSENNNNKYCTILFNDGKYLCGTNSTSTPYLSASPSNNNNRWIMMHASSSPSGSLTSSYDIKLRYYNSSRSGSQGKYTYTYYYLQYIPGTNEFKMTTDINDASIFHIFTIRLKEN